MSDDGADHSDNEIAPNATYIALRYTYALATCWNVCVLHLHLVQVRNINERVKIPVLVEALRGIFAEYGNIQEIIAKKSLKRKGQAFIVYDDIESAQNAIDEINGFEIFGQQLSLDFAKTRSDITVKNEDGDEALEAHKQQRIAERERKEKEEAAKAAEAKRNKRSHADDEQDSRPAKYTKTSTAANKDVPDEYLPANPTLTIRDLPDNTTRDELVSAFGAFAGFKEARTVPGRPLAFVEYDTAELAAAAKEATNGVAIRGSVLKVTFRRG